MSRGKQGTKGGRAAKNRAFQQQLRERKRLRKERREQYAPPARTPAQAQANRAKTVTAWELSGQTVPDLRNLAKGLDVKLPSKARKADIIGAILKAQEG